MLRTLVFVLSFGFFVPQAFAFGLTADQMYRNLLANENHGVVPSYYAVSRPGEKPLLAFKKADSKTEKIWREKEGSFLDAQKPEALSSVKQTQDWREIVGNVRNGHVTPFELEIIRRRSDNSDVEAVELLAWMYATGTGLKQNLTKSWTYYLQAAHLGVPTATTNAKAVYQAMSASERSHLPSF